MVESDVERLKTKLIQAAQDESGDDWFAGKRAFACHLLDCFFPEVRLPPKPEDIDTGVY